MTLQKQCLRLSRQRAVPNDFMPFVLLYILKYGNEGSMGLQRISATFGLSIGTISNYLHHVASFLHQVLKQNADSRIEWPTPQECAYMEGFVYGFPKIICFVDRTKTQVYRPQDPNNQIQRFDGHHHIHCFTCLVWTNVYGLIIRLGISFEGNEHDKGLSNESDPCRMFSEFFNNGLCRMAGTGSVRVHDFFVLILMSKQERGFKYSIHLNRDVHKQQICNKWSIGLVKNLFRLFAGRYAYKDSLFSILFEVACLLFNWWIRNSDTPPVLLERILARLELYFREGYSLSFWYPSVYLSFLHWHPR